ncbi:hypothetical protein [Sinorhizobium meliloti]|uniref:hypothetical protein n=1 Tax=Rhizobium meliloti TaxID=382 RepID=UPI003F139354
MATRHDYDPKALTAARRRELTKPGRAKMGGRGSGLTPRVKKAIEALVHGLDPDRTLAVTIEQAAELAGITGRALRTARLKPAVEAYYQQQMAALRNGLKPASLRVIEAIRDDPALKSNAAGAKVRLDAAKTLAFDPPGQSNINVNVGVGVSGTTPGYVIDLSEPAERGPIIEHAPIVSPSEGI